MTPEEIERSWLSRGQLNIFKWLNEIGFFHKHVIRDSNSLFRVISEFLYKTQRKHAIVRKQCVSLLEEFGTKYFNLGECVPFQEYIDLLANQSTYGRLREIPLLSFLARRDIIVIDSIDGPILKFCKNFGNPIYIYYQHNIKHFDILLNIDEIRIAALAQSLFYESLYVGVFKITDTAHITNRMLSDASKDYVETNLKSRKKPGNGSNNTCKNTTKYELQKYNAPSYGVSDKTNIPPFSYKVARGISPSVYKNLDLDIWIEAKKDKDMANRYYGLTLQVGAKCLCKIKPDQMLPYKCYIQEMMSDGTCIVFIEQLGEMKSLHISQLETLPPSEVKGWWITSPKKGHRFVKKCQAKKKKTIIGAQIISKYINQNKVGFKTRVIENQVNDFNNNSLIGETELSDYCAIEWKEKHDTEDIFTKYNRLESFKPSYPVEFITLPFTIESNNGNNESVTPPTQNRPYTYPPISNSNGSPTNQYSGNTPNNPETNGTPALNQVTSTAIFQPPPGICTTNSYSSTYQSFPYYCVNPIQISSIRTPAPVNLHVQHQMARPIMPFGGVNLNAQRSINQNGCDLPYNDVSTLRFFYNLGIEWMQATGGAYPPHLSGPPPSTSMVLPNMNYYGSSATTPNQLALDLQNNLTLDDSPSNSPPQNNKNYNNMNPKTNGGKPEYRANRGGSNNGRFKRNDSERNSYKNNFNRSGSYNNNNNKKGNGVRGGYYNDATPPINQDKKEQTQESDQVLRESPSMSSLPCISYPPPPYSRYQYYPDGEGPMYPYGGYTSHFVPYNNPTEEGVSPSPVEGGYMPPPGSVPPPPHYMPYYPSQLIYSSNNYFPPNDQSK